MPARGGAQYDAARERSAAVSGASNGASTAARALAFARGGWPVFPCRPGGKEPATRYGFHDATTDPDQIRSWWRREPAANLAIATGSPGPDVLDVDQHGAAGNGFAAFNRLKRAGIVDSASAIVGTPGGGLHAYFTGSDQSSGRLRGQHLDFRARGGYVVAPPSQIDGKRYRVLARQAQAGGLDWAAAVRLLEPDRERGVHVRVGRDVSHLASWVAGLRPDSHNRNDGLFWAACRAVEAGDDTVLSDLAAAARSTGLTEREISRTIESARRTAECRPFERQIGREVTS